jgi:hypothetical protein
METAPHIVIAYLDDLSDESVTRTRKRLVEDLTTACGEAPKALHVSRSPMCFVAVGDLMKISQAVHDAIAPNARYMVVQPGKSFAAYGLGAAQAVLERGLRQAGRIPPA